MGLNTLIIYRMESITWVWNWTLSQDIQCNHILSASCIAREPYTCHSSDCFEVLRDNLLEPPRYLRSSLPGDQNIYTSNIRRRYGRYARVGAILASHQR